MLFRRRKTFDISGVRASELKNTLRTRIGRLYKEFELSAPLGQLRAVKVFFVGPT